MKIYITIIFLFLCVNVNAKFSAKPLDEVVTKFIYDYNDSAVIILNSKNAKIEYVFNKKIAIEKIFPPGSIAKIWTTIILLENKKRFNFNHNHRIKCNGKFILSNNILLTKSDWNIFNIQKEKNINYYKCSLKDGHNHVSLHDAIVNSCNIYFLNWASKNPDFIYDQLVNFWHLNENTGLSNPKIMEVPGRRIRNISQFQKIAAAIGEGGNIRVSPLKVAQTFISIFEGKPLLVPHFSNFKRTNIQYSLRISESTRHIVLAALSETIKKGTLKGIKIKNKNVKIIAGKTGSGTHYKKKFLTHGWNVIYFKYFNKNYVMVTFVYKGFGGSTAKELSQRILNGL